MFVFFYHAYPTTILLCSGLVMTFSFVPLLYNNGDIVTATPVGPLLSATMLACCVVAVLGSLRCYYDHVQPMRELISGRHYNGVYPQLPATAFGDAAFVSFANRTTIDKSNAVGMKSLNSGFNTFCVAPIKNDANSGRIEFWAVGADCCSGSGTDFDCDDSSDGNAHNAWVLREPTDALYFWLGRHIAAPIMRRDIFLEAITQAEHVHSITTSKDAVLVRWTKQTKNDLIRSEIWMVGLALLLVVVGSAVMAVILSKLNAWYTELRHQQHNKRFGSKGVGNMSARFMDFIQILNEEKEALAMHAESFRPNLSSWDTCLLGVVIPFIVLHSCLLLGSYGGCMTHGTLVTAFVCSIFGVMILSMLLTKNRVINGLCIMLCAFGGLHIGFVNYENNMFQYCSIEDGRSYENVMPGASAKEYTDAGKINFASSARLSQNHSVGYIYQDVTYCVAPIISHGSPCYDTVNSNEAPSFETSAALLDRRMPIFLQKESRMHKSSRSKHEGHMPRAIVDESRALSALQHRATTHSQNCDERIEFWAMGIDCCDSRGNFECDDAEDASAKAAVVVHPFGNYLPHLCKKMLLPTTFCDSINIDNDGATGSLAEARRQLLNAVDQAVAANGFTTPENIVFLRWGKNADDLQGKYKSRSLSVVAITSMIALVLMIAVSSLDHFYLKVNRRAEDRWLQEQQDREPQGASQTPGGQNPAYFSKARESLRV